MEEKQHLPNERLEWIYTRLAIRNGADPKTIKFSIVSKEEKNDEQA